MTAAAKPSTAIPRFNEQELFRIANKHQRIAEFHDVKGSNIQVPQFDRYDHLAASVLILEAIEAHADERQANLEKIALLRGELGQVKAVAARAREEADAANAMLEQLRPKDDDGSRSARFAPTAMGLAALETAKIDERLEILDAP